MSAGGERIWDGKLPGKRVALQSGNRTQSGIRAPVSV